MNTSAWSLPGKRFGALDLAIVANIRHGCRMLGSVSLNFAYKQERSRVKITAPLPAYSDA